MPNQQKPLEENARVTLLTQGTLADGRAYWAYVEMAPSKAMAFRQAQETLADFDMQDFGTVLNWGIGQEVPAETRTQMEREHGVRHGLEAALTGGPKR